MGLLILFSVWNINSDCTILIHTIISLNQSMLVYFENFEFGYRKSFWFRDEKILELGIFCILELLIFPYTNMCSKVKMEF